MFNTVAIQKIVFFLQGGDTGLEVTVETVVEVYPIPQPSRGSGERRKLPRGSGTLTLELHSGAEPHRKRCLGVLCVILCHFSHVLGLVQFGRWLSGIITPKI